MVVDLLDLPVTMECVCQRTLCVMALTPVETTVMRNTTVVRNNNCAVCFSVTPP